MQHRLSRWGIGPRIAAAAGAYAIVAAVATCAWPEVCVLRSAAGVWRAGGAILLAAGIPLWLSGVAAAMRAYNRDELVTTGVFGLVRHPIYSAWIVLILPGIALLCRAWPLLGMSLAAYAVFKLAIRREDRYLEQRFGPAYRAYRRRVNEILPLPRVHNASPKR